MIKIIWSILNISILLYFIYLIIKLISQGKNFFKGRFRVISILILVLGIFNIIIASSKPKNNNTIKFAYEKEFQNSEIKNLIIEDNLSLDINLTVEYLIDSKKIIPIESTSYISGLVSGFEWEIISLKTNNPQEFEKEILEGVGLLNWNLFGILIYSQEKVFLTKFDTTKNS